MRKGLLFFCGLLAATVAASSGCSDDAEPEPNSEGERVYRETVAGGNTFTCATCHALEEPAEDYRRPGHPIGDATRRPSYKNGQLTNMLDAVNSCLEEWMTADPWTSTDQRWLDLHDFLDQQAPKGGAEPLSFEIVEPPADLSGGDPDVGRETFNASCAVCHGENGVGTEKAIQVAGFGHTPEYVGRRVRTSGALESPIYEGLTGGRMPFWAKDRLLDEELRDIAAYLAQGGTASTDTGDETGGATSTSGGTGDTGGTMGETTADTTGDPTAGDCPSTHARVGWVTDLSNLFHNVGGHAEIVDDCTVVITNFTYDGTGIDVRLYGAEGTDYDNGFAMTDDLLKNGGYNGETLIATLPDGMTLGDLDSISVWCVTVGVDFGSGTFSPP